MKKFLLGVGVALFAMVLVGGWFCLQSFGRTSLSVRNATSEPIPQVAVKSNIGSELLIQNLAAGETRTLRLSGRDSLIWLVVHQRSGHVVESDRTYSCSGLALHASILKGGIRLGGGYSEDRIVWE